MQHGSWSAPRATPWIGQTVQIRSKIIEQGGQQKLAIEMQFPDAKQQFGWHHLGLARRTVSFLIIPQDSRKLCWLIVQDLSLQLGKPVN